MVGNPAPDLAPVSAASARVLSAKTASVALAPDDGETVLLGEKKKWINCRPLGTSSWIPTEIEYH